MKQIASPLAVERPAWPKAWPGEGEKGRGLPTYFPLTLTLSRQRRGEKTSSLELKWYHLLIRNLLIFWLVRLLIFFWFSFLFGSGFFSFG